VSGIRAWFHEEGIAAQGVLILCGKTGTRKTTFVKGLLPSSMLLEGHVLNTHRDGNKITALSRSITEMGEIMASIKVSGNDELKGFFTTEEDSIRVPYGKVDTIRPRRTIFTGTVNDARFLSDETGNRRYWVIDIDALINTDHGVDPQQLWAEAKQLYDNGAKWYLTPEQEQMVADINKHHEIENEMEELLLSRYDWKEPRDRYLNCAQIMDDLGLQIENKRAIDLMRKALRKMQEEDPNVRTHRVKKGIVYEIPRLILNIPRRESL
jgi:putative DNA primase/helicase